MIPLRTQRLVLRDFRIEDMDDLLHVFGDAEVMRFGDGMQSPEWVAGWLSACVESYRRRGFGPYAVVRRGQEELIGYCGLFPFPDVNGKEEIEIGYRLRRSAWGQGYAAEAALAVRDYALGVLRIPRLIAIIDPENAASIRVAKKIGMQYEAPVTFEGYTHPDHIYAVTKPSSRQ